MENDERQDTVKDIVAEMRRFGDRHWMHDEGQAVREFANRIEAALEREREAVEADALAVGGIVEAARHTPGNAAAMREALREAIGETCAGCKRDCDDCMNLKSGWMKKAKAALSAPPRQCDVGTAEEKYQRWVHFCEQRLHICHNCEINSPVGCTFKFGDMPYEAEEGAGE